MNNNRKKISRSEKILLFLYELGSGEKKKFLYEDIVVGLFKKYPEVFHLKGYPRYPDSSDSTQRLLYEYKKGGYVNVANKIFSLTDRGIELAQNLLNEKRDSKKDILSSRLSRAATTEIERIKNLEGFNLFLEGKEKDHTDSDFYKYLGVTARTSSSAFSGRLNTVESVVQNMNKKSDNPLYSKIVGYHKFLLSKYGDIINYFVKK